MVRFIAPVHTLASGARTVGARLEDGQTKAAGVPFIEAIIAPKTTRTEGRFGVPIEVPETMIVTCKDAPNPVPAGWVVDDLFTEEVQEDFILRHDRVRGKRSPKKPRAQGGQ